MMPRGLYIHWPFCLSKCPYCDFNSRPLPSSVDEDAMGRAYLDELSFYANQIEAGALSSVYFGGGTPSLMRPQTVEVIIRAAENLWGLSPECEITLEANPSSVEIEKFKAFRDAGVNRLSLGVQSLRDDALLFLGRAHDVAGARRAIETAQTVFDRFSFDLIYARAGQTLSDWEEDLAEALTLGARHLSLYQLTIEMGTVFYKRARTEDLRTDEETATQMFLMTQQMTAAAGLPAYEISNHAAMGQESRHNLLYWHYDDYLGIGAGAHGRFCDRTGQRWATENKSRPDLWLAEVQKSGNGQSGSERVKEETAKAEALMMGLRLTAGINFSAWEEKFGSGLDAFLPAIKKETLVNEGLLSQTETALSATEEGRLKLNAVLGYLLA